MSNFCKHLMFVDKNINVAGMGSLTVVFAIFPWLLNFIVTHFKISLEGKKNTRNKERKCTAHSSSTKYILFISRQANYFYFILVKCNYVAICLFMPVAIVKFNQFYNALRFSLTLQNVQLCMYATTWTESKDELVKFLYFSFILWQSTWSVKNHVTQNNYTWLNGLNILHFTIYFSIKISSAIKQLQIFVGMFSGLNSLDAKHALLKSAS